MSERVIHIVGIDPVRLLGLNGEILKVLADHFPKLKIVHRGHDLKIAGTDAQINAFELKLSLFKKQLDQYNILTEDLAIDILTTNQDTDRAKSKDKKVLVYGNKGLKVTARTPNQQKMVDEIEQHDILFAVGPAGTGKTYTAVALAVRALKNKEVRRIILTRPALEAGENLGFLPGDVKEKLDPYLQPLYDALRDMIPGEKLNELMEKGTIQIAPLGFMRGRTLDNAFVILDEGQNTTENQIKMFLTRMGKSAKFIVTGDITQIDLSKHQTSGLKKAIEVLSNIDGISFVFLTIQDVVRHRLVKKIIKAFQ